MAGGEEQQPQQHSMNTDQGAPGREQRPPPADEDGNTKNTLLVVITLITTLSFQVGVNPPGGFWQEDKDGHVAGNAIMRDKNPLRYRCLSIFSWMCFWASVVLILYLLNGASLKSRFFKGTFVFCIATLAFLFQISQTIAYLPTAFIFSSCIMLWAMWVIRKAK